MLNLLSVTLFPKNVPRESKWEWFSVMAAILVVASMLRGFALGRSAYWYDEVVTIRRPRHPIWPRCSSFSRRPMPLARSYILFCSTDGLKSLARQKSVRGRSV